jgi:hypothetical protein
MAIKKEEEEDCKPTLDVVSATVTTTNKITKPKSFKNNNIPLSAQHAKAEDDTDTKSLLQSGSNSSKSGKAPTISQKQINQLISYIVIDSMSIPKASRKVNICTTTGRHYYNVYKNDPYKKISSPPNPYVQTARLYTLEQIENLIRYISQDKMPVVQAAAKANITYKVAQRFYNRYLKNPTRAITLPNVRPYYSQNKKKTNSFTLLSTTRCLYRQLQKKRN